MLRREGKMATEILLLRDSSVEEKDECGEFWGG